MKKLLKRCHCKNRLDFVMKVILTLIVFLVTALVMVAICG